MTAAAITALGALTSVGRDAATTCASIRAGIARSAPVEDFLVLDYDEYAEVPLIGSPVDGLTNGFSNAGRWLQLASPALEEVLRHGKAPSSADRTFWSKTRLDLVVPVIDERFPEELGINEHTLEETLLRPLLKRVEGNAQPAQSRVLARGRVGVLDALLDARAALASGTVERWIVLAVDSLVDASALRWLADSGRLKSDVDPCGLTPGEAAIALLVESPAAAAARGVSPLAVMRSIVTGQESKSLAGGARSQGEALARAIDQALAEGRLGQPYGASAIVDLNGETWRAEELGYAMVRVPRTSWTAAGWTAPAMSTGDVGAASAALEVAVACASFERRYAREPAVLICCSDEHGRVGAVLAGEGHAAR